MKTSNRNSRLALAAALCLALPMATSGMRANEHVAIVQQQRTMKGTVVDKAGEPVIGASVVVKGTTIGGITDLDGNFTISPLPDKAIIQVSYIGYKSQELPAGDKSSMRIVLEEDNAMLDEVVVVGYGTMKKSDITGSVGSFSAEKLSKRGTTSVVDAMQGAIPGVSITQTSSRANSGFNIQIRGQASINKQAQPLYVIDGVVCESMDFLNPDDIERIDVLKDASSTAIYGSRASAGVIMITTKGSKGAEKAQRINISYDGYYGLKKTARMPDFMDAQEFIDFRFARFTTMDTQKYEGSTRPGVDAQGHPHYVITEANLNTAFLKRIGGADYRDSKMYEMMMEGGEGYDWTDYVTRTAQQQNHFISASGATDKVSFRLGIGYQNEENVFKENDYQRLNLKGALDAKISKVFEAGLSVNLATSKTDDFCTNSTYSPYQNAFFFCPIVSPYDADGHLINNPGAKAAFDSDSQFTSTVNPLIDLYNKNYLNETNQYNVLANVYLRANLYDGLKLTTTFSPNYRHSQRTQ